MNRREWLSSTVPAAAAAAIAGGSASAIATPRDNRRVALVMVALADILTAFAGPHQCIASRIVSPPESPLPDDAMVLGVSYDMERDAFVLRVASESFAEVPEGSYPPFFDERVRGVSYELLCRRADGTYTSKVGGET